MLCGPPLFLHSGCFNTKETATQLELSEQFRALSLLFSSSLENVGGYFLANILSLFTLRFQLCTYNKQTNRGYFWMCHSFQLYCMCHLGYFNVCFSVLFIKYPVNSIQSIFFTLNTVFSTFMSSVYATFKGYDHTPPNLILSYFMAFKICVIYPLINS